jgi:Flp pilus assembly protein TadG
VELVLVLPVVVLLALVVVQLAVVARAEVMVVHAAREGARAAAVEASEHAAERAAAETLDRARLRVSAVIDRRSGGLARVQVRYRVPTDLPLVGPLVPDPELSAEVVMMVEDPAVS